MGQNLAVLVAVSVSGLLAVAISTSPVVAQRVLTVDASNDLPDTNLTDSSCSTSEATCSLRAAIEEANAVAGPDTIIFDIPAANDAGCNAGTGVCTIQPDSVLPSITDSLVIDGESQPGATCGSGFASRDLKVVLDGSNAGSASGLVLTSAVASARIHGLTINNFSTHGIDLQGADSVWVSCNNIGTDVTGSLDEGNFSGISAPNDANAQYLIVGTNGDGIDDAREGNIISGNAFGIALARDNPDARVSGNYIGFNAAGTGTVGNSSRGMNLFQPARLLIGTDGDGTSDRLEANVIVGNAIGIQADGQATYKIAGNFIGTDTSGTQDFGNIGTPLGISGFDSFVGFDGTGSLETERNVIAFNGGSIGVTSAARRVAILGNSMYSNRGIGIDLIPSGVTPNDSADVDGGANNRQNFPELISADLGSFTVIYSVDSDTAHSAYPLRVEFFKADIDKQEGERFLGSDMYTVDEWSSCGTKPCPDTVTFSSVELTPSASVVATATDSLGNTSEFSAPIRAAFSGASLRIRAFLEGAYNPASNRMNTGLLDGAALPLSQPFSNTDYDGTVLDFDSLQSVIVHSDSTVDWMLVSLRTGTESGSTIASATHAAVIYEGGTVGEIEDDSLHFVGVSSGSYYLVLHSRNHLDVMSDTAIVVSGGVGSHDFTPAATAAYPGNDASAQKQLEPGVFGMYAADASIDGQVTASDFNLWLTSTKAVETGYLLTDFNLDAQVTASDFNLWLVNTKAVASSKVP
jgi:hypothetical protein